MLGDFVVAECPAQGVDEVVQRDEALGGHAVRARLLPQSEPLAVRAVPAAAVAGLEMRQLVSKAGAPLRLADPSCVAISRLRTASLVCACCAKQPRVLTVVAGPAALLRD